MKSVKDDVECCANCRYFVATPKGNRYNDVEYFCIAMGYFMLGSSIYKDRNTLRHFTPGGRELKCCYERGEDRKDG